MQRVQCEKIILPICSPQRALQALVLRQYTHGHYKPLSPLTPRHQQLENRVPWNHLFPTYLSWLPVQIVFVVRGALHRLTTSRKFCEVITTTFPLLLELSLLPVNPLFAFPHPILFHPAALHHPLCPPLHHPL